MGSTSHPNVMVDAQDITVPYGYIIVACSFLLQAISGGISFSVGGYYIEFLETFGESKGITAWIGSINSGLLFGGGEWISVYDIRNLN